jgi:hypothetical protein
MKMTEKQLARWAKVREKGRARYILLYGVLFWGVLTGALWAVAMAAVQGWDRLPTYLAFGLIGFPIGGVLFGAWTWKIAEARYREAADTPDPG